jgi:ATP-binding cassette, subfamily B, bacterial CvaB/MchF/RaxB
MSRLIEALDFGWRTRLPLVLQSEEAECGLASLAMVMAFHGKSLALPELRRRFGMSLRGATLKDLARIAAALSLTARPLRLELEELALLKTPAILHWDLNHFVVLAEVTTKDVTIHDPAIGIRRLPMSEVSKHFTGVAMELTPAVGIEAEKPTPRIRMRSLIGNMIGVKSSLARVFSVALTIEVFVALTPLYMQWTLDDALVTADRDLMTTLALAFALLLMFRVLFTAFRGWMLLAIGASVKVQGRANLFGHLVNLSASYFESRQLGDILSRFGSQETILQALTTDVVEAMLDGILAIGTLALMFVFAPTLAFVVLVGTIVYAILRWATYTPLRHASVEALAWTARRDTHFLETLRGMKTIKLFNAEDERGRGWLNLLVESMNRQLTTQKLQIVFTTANLFVSGTVALLVVCFGARQVLDRGLTVGALVAFIAYKDQFSTRITALINRGLDLQMLHIHGERLADIVMTQPEERDYSELADVGPGQVEATSMHPPTIELKNLRFRYSEHDPWVLDGVDLRIEPGESVAIVGESGCGKSTLLKILMTLLRPAEGEGTISVDGQLVSQLGVSRYRNMLGVVMQDDQLFAGSISDNISFFAESPDPKRIEACAKAAAVHDAITAMPMGYATLIGDMGGALSGGQKQRILIARALYRKPRILLLDEATSHLDVACERAVNAALAIQARAVTRVIVAHRPETIMSADRVVVMANGKIVGQRRKTDLTGSPLAAAQAKLSPAPAQPVPEPVRDVESGPRLSEESVA